jgi:hypothetical protein
VTDAPPPTVALRIGVDRSVEPGPGGRTNYVGRIVDETPDRPWEARIRRELFIPVGSGDALEVAVPAGLYTVEAATPSGRLLSRDVTIAGDETRVDVDLVDGAGGRSRLRSGFGFGARFGGSNALRIDLNEIEELKRPSVTNYSVTLSDSDDVGAPARSARALLVAPVLLLGIGAPLGIESLTGFFSANAGLLLRLLAGTVAVAALVILAAFLWLLWDNRKHATVGKVHIAHSYRDSSFGREAWTRQVVVGRLRRETANDPAPAALRIAGALGEVGGIEASGALDDPRTVEPTRNRARDRGRLTIGADILDLDPFDPAQFGTSLCMTVSRGHEGQDFGELLSLPIPWRSDAGAPEASIALEVPPWTGDDRLRATVEDGEFATILGYLTSGQLTEARQLVDRAVGHLQAKQVNPYAAAAGGYVLLATDAERTDQVWREWIRNLYRWFPNLADGAVLEGWNLLQTMPDDQAPDRARLRFLEAMDRGVPVFTAGLRRLRDGLAMFAAEPDPDGRVAKAAAAVEIMALRCNPAQPFTSLRIGRAE